MDQKVDKNVLHKEKIYRQIVLPIVIDSIYMFSEQNKPITTDASAQNES